MDRCKNCRLPSTTIYCNICNNLTECQQCGRRLSPQLFEYQANICNACYRKRQRVRSAMGGLVEEHEIPISGIHGDLHVFMAEHERDVLSILEEAMNLHG